MDRDRPALADGALRELLLYHFCRLQLPAVRVSPETFGRHLQRTFELYKAKTPDATRAAYVDTLYAVDWYLCVGCLERQQAAWERLFASRTGRTDCLLVDALRARAVRLYPRDDEKQDSAVLEFWSHLLVPAVAGTPATLARYDGHRPPGPWLVPVFHNLHTSQLPSPSGAPPLPRHH